MPQKGIDQSSRDLLFKTIKSIKDDDLLDFLTSLLSSAEIKDISRRTMAAKMLKEKSTYREISDTMGMSEGTVNKIHFKTRGSSIINKIFSKP